MPLSYLVTEDTYWAGQGGEPAKAMPFSLPTVEVTSLVCSRLKTLLLNRHLAQYLPRKLGFTFRDSAERVRVLGDVYSEYFTHPPAAHS